MSLGLADHVNIQHLTAQALAVLTQTRGSRVKRGGELDKRIALDIRGRLGLQVAVSLKGYCNLQFQIYLVHRYSRYPAILLKYSLHIDFDHLKGVEVSDKDPDKRQK